MSDCVLRVEKLTNGYEVEVYDPDIAAANQKPKSNWKDPWKGYAFSTIAEVIAFITKALPMLKGSGDEEESMFDKFANEEAAENE